MDNYLDIKKLRIESMKRGTKFVIDFHSRDKKTKYKTKTSDYMKYKVDNDDFIVADSLIFGDNNDTFIDIYDLEYIDDILDGDSSEIFSKNKISIYGNDIKLNKLKSDILKLLANLLPNSCTVYRIKINNELDELDTYSIKYIDTSIKYKDGNFIDNDEKIVYLPDNQLPLDGSIVKILATDLFNDISFVIKLKR